MLHNATLVERESSKGKKGRKGWTYVGSSPVLHGRLHLFSLRARRRAAATRVPHRTVPTQFSNGRPSCLSKEHCAGLIASQISAVAIRIPLKGSGRRVYGARFIGMTFLCLTARLSQALKESSEALMLLCIVKFVTKICNRKILY